MTGPSPAKPEAARREALAVAIEVERSAILKAYVDGLAAIGSPVVGDPTSKRQVMEHANQILSDVIKCIRAGSVQILHETGSFAGEIGQTRAAHGVHPRESLRAAVALFEVTTASALRHVGLQEDSPHLLSLVTLAMNQSISMRIRQAVIAYSGFLLERIHEAHVEERRRIARELHDHIGHGLAVIHQQLELYDLYRASDPVLASAPVEIALQCAEQAMRELRALISGLRLEDWSQNLEKALVAFLEGVRHDDVEVRLRVNGDESWAPPAVRDESFLIMREAVRNALRHGQASSVFINVDITPDELRAAIEDDGTGFDPSAVSASAGLSAMRERAELMGGSVVVSTEPGRGTHVELLVPLPGGNGERA